MIKILADAINLQILCTVSVTYDCNDDSYEKKTQYGNSLRDVMGSFHIIIEAFEEYSATVPVNQKILAVFTHSESHLRTFFSLGSLCYLAVFCLITVSLNCTRWFRPRC